MASPQQITYLSHRAFIGTNEAARAATPGAFYAQIDYWNKEMVKAGWPAGSSVITYCIAQIMLESDYMTSSVAQYDNNYTGIKWINKSYQDATRGRQSPEGGNYAHYGDIQAFLKDYKRILSINGAAGRPIDATSAQQFQNALLANHYFTDPNYATKFNSALKRVRESILANQGQEKKFLDQYNKGQTIFTYDPQKGGLVNNAPFDAGRYANLVQQWATEHPFLAIGAGVTGLFVISKILK